MAIAWRPMTTADIAALVTIAAIVHPGYPESEDVLVERLALYPDGCFILDDDGIASGYVLSHPWRYGAPPSLDHTLGALPEKPDTYYLHDIAILPHCQGQDAAKIVFEKIASHARAKKFATVTLCAVNGSVPFWTRRGFALVTVPGLNEKLLSYGTDVHFMALGLTD